MYGLFSATFKVTHQRQCVSPAKAVDSLLSIETFSKARASQQVIYSLRKAVSKGQGSSEQQSREGVALVQGQHFRSGVTVHRSRNLLRFDGKHGKLWLRCGATPLQYPPLYGPEISAVCSYWCWAFSLLQPKPLLQRKHSSKHSKRLLCLTFMVLSFKKKKLVLHYIFM